jgi:hypothetical protein
MRLVLFAALLSSCDHSGIACGFAAASAYCTCEYRSFANGFTCSSGTVGEACCASPRWPATGESCVCGNYWPTCLTDGNSCSCGLGLVEQGTQHSVASCSPSPPFGATWRCCSASGLDYDCTCSAANQTNGCPSGTVETTGCGDKFEGQSWTPCMQSPIANAHVVARCSAPPTPE